MNESVSQSVSQSVRGGGYQGRIQKGWSSGGGGGGIPGVFDLYLPQIGIVQFSLFTHCRQLLPGGGGGKYTFRKTTGNIRGMRRTSIHNIPVIGIQT